ncbi:hypothetical protein FPQ18DRAFT_399584 [Pyronema domesticum]|nr:hypothetical protein FPQ18DRAFT_399584 [Pyronema domesticum]
MDSDGFIDIHDVKPELITPPDDYDVLISDVTHKTLGTTIAEELGAPYLGKATTTDAEERATNALGIQEETEAWVTLGGRKDIDHVVPSKSHFTGVNLLANMNNISLEHASLAVHLERMQNIPAFDAGAQILQAIAALSRRMDEQMQQQDQKMQQAMQQIHQEISRS